MKKHIWKIGIVVVALLIGALGWQMKSGVQHESMQGAPQYVLPASPSEVKDILNTESLEEVKAYAESIAGAEAETVAESDQEVTAEPEQEEITICMVGDILMHVGVEDASLTEDGEYDYSAIFDGTRDIISSYDIAIVNEEVIIGGKEIGISGYPCFNADYTLADELVATGFNVIAHATNHALDKGGRGVSNCLSYWDENYPDITVLGIHDSNEDQNEISVIEEKGVRFALLNYTYGTNGIALPDGMPYAVDYLEEGRLREDIRRAKEMSDFIIVIPHWGTEYRLTPDSWQEKYTSIMLEEGVDLVIGAHPHVIEPVELLQREDGHQMLVYYSLGNFVAWTSSVGEGVSNRSLGAIASVTVGVEDETPYVQDYGVIPVVAHLTDGFGGVTVYTLEDYTDEMGQENLIKLQDPHFSREYCVKLADEVFGEGAYASQH